MYELQKMLNLKNNQSLLKVSHGTTHYVKNQYAKTVNQGEEIIGA